MIRSNQRQSIEEIKESWHDHAIETTEEYNDLFSRIKANDATWFDDYMRYVDRYYEVEVCGGAGHVVFDDGNLENCHVEWCAGYAAGIGDHQGGELLELMRTMTMKQRRRVYDKLCHG